MKKILLVACAMCSLGANAQHLEWDAAQLPQTTEEGATQGFTVYYDYLFTPANYTLCEGSGFKAYFEHPTLLGKGNAAYHPGRTYTMKPLMGMNQSTRDGIDPAFFAFYGLGDGNDYVRTNDAGEPYGTYTDAIVTIEVASADDGGEYGKVALNYGKGDNLSVMYVVDASIGEEGMMVLQNRTRSTVPEGTDNKTHTAQFGVEPGHKYYVMASEKQSVELYGIGFSPISADNYETTNISTGIANVTANKVQNNNVMYNLAGQRIAAPVSGQIYILNGKKYIAK